jgi:hypothetical protein
MTDSINADDGENGGDETARSSRSLTTVALSPGGMGVEYGLRERKKREVRVHLSRPQPHWLESEGCTTSGVEDIVERVGVSRRTFSNYFANKEEAIVDRHLQRARTRAASCVSARRASRSDTH